MNNTNDLISRAAATRAAVISVRDYLGNIDSERDIHIEEGLHEVPTVDAAPIVHGRWVYEHGDPDMLPCSVCGYRVFRYNNTRYCPNCGARMDDESRVQSELL